MNIMMDLDGVIYEFTKVVTRFESEATGIQLPQPVVWDFVFEQWGWEKSKDLNMKILLNKWAEAGLFNLPDGGFEDSVREVREVLNSGEHFITFYTSRPSSAEKDTLLWVEGAFGDFSNWDLIVKSGEKTGGHRFDAALDDMWLNIESLKATGCANSTLYDRPWNQHISGHKRVFSVSEFFDSI